MSPVARLARLPGRNLLSAHLANFNPADGDEAQEPKRCNLNFCVVRAYSSFVPLCYFTHKASSHASEAILTAMFIIIIIIIYLPY